jgi:hypothetical protein
MQSLHFLLLVLGLLFNLLKAGAAKKDLESIILTDIESGDCAACDVGGTLSILCRSKASKEVFDDVF